MFRLFKFLIRCITFGVLCGPKPLLFVECVNLSILKRVDSMNVKVKLSWVGSVSGDVARYNVEVTNDNGDVVVEDTVSSITRDYVFNAASDSVLSASVTAVDDADNESLPAVATLVVPDMTAPLPPTDVTMEIVEVKAEEV